MKPKKGGMRDHFAAAVSRRSVLKGAAAFAMARSVTVMAQQSSNAYAYVGTYTPNGKGIHVFSLDPSNGNLTFVKAYSEIASPSALALDPHGRFLFAVSEVSNYKPVSFGGGGPTGAVAAYTVDRATGDLKLVNVMSSYGAGPAHIAVDPTGQYVFVANYGGGSVSVIPYNQSSGALGLPTDVRVLTGPLGPTTAEGAPPGSFANSGHDAHHAHMAATDPSGKWVLVCDLGNDQVDVWQFDTVSGRLNTSFPPGVVPPGAGARHFAFHSNGRWCYVINEEASTMTFFTFDPSSGALEAKQTLSTLPEGFTGTNYTSEVGISSDDKFLYGVNRLHDTVAVFSIDSATGALTLMGETPTGGDYPRSFAFDPSGNYLYVLNQRSDNIGVLKVDRSTGLLTHTGLYPACGSPSSIVFLS